MHCFIQWDDRIKEHLAVFYRVYLKRTNSEVCLGKGVEVMDVLIRGKSKHMQKCLCHKTETLEMQSFQCKQD